MTDRRPQRHPGLVARVGCRAVRDVAARGDLAARPHAARVHRAARSAGAAAGARGQRAGRAAAETRSAERRTLRAARSIVPRRAAPAAAAVGPAPSARALREPNVSSATPARIARVPYRPRAAATARCSEPRRLWAIADRLRPDGVTDQSDDDRDVPGEPAAFGGNINVLRAGVNVAPARDRRLRFAWPRPSPMPRCNARPTSGRTARRGWPAAPFAAGRNRGRASSGVPRLPRPRRVRAATPPPARRSRCAPRLRPRAAASAEESRRLLEVRNAELQQLADRPRGAANRRAASGARESRRPASISSVTSSCSPTRRTDAPAPAAEAPPAPAPARYARPSPASRRLVSRAVGWLLSPLLWIGLGVAALLLTALWFVRRRRARHRRRHGSLGSARVGDGRGSKTARDSDGAPAPAGRRANDRRRRAARRATAPPSRSRSAPCVAAASRPQRAAAPSRRDAVEPDGHQSRSGRCRGRGRLPHRLRSLRPGGGARAESARGGARPARPQAEAARSLLHVGQQGCVPERGPEPARPTSANADDPDWDKVVIMGRQICPDERLFTEATTACGSRRRRSRGRRLAARSRVRRRSVRRRGCRSRYGPRFQPRKLRSSGRRRSRPNRRGPSPRDFDGDALDIGARTAAGLEAALFEDLAQDQEEKSSQTTPDLAADSLAVTQESPTIERPGELRLGHESRVPRRSSRPRLRPSKLRRSKVPRPGPLQP